MGLEAVEGILLGIVLTPPASYFILRGMGYTGDEILDSAGRLALSCLDRVLPRRRPTVNITINLGQGVKDQNRNGGNWEVVDGPAREITTDFGNGPSPSRRLIELSDSEKDLKSLGI